MPPENRPPPPKRPRSVFSLFASAVVAGAIFALVMESGVGLVGGWNIPQHSAQVLGETTTNSRLSNTDFVPDILNAIRTNLKWVAIISFKSTVDNPYAELGARHFQALLNRLQITTLRLASLAAYAPAMLLIFVATVADATVERRLRARAGGKESGYLYHRLQKLRGTGAICAGLSFPGMAVACFCDSGRIDRFSSRVFHLVAARAVQKDSLSCCISIALRTALQQNRFELVGSLSTISA